MLHGCAQVRGLAEEFLAIAVLSEEGVPVETVLCG